MPFDFLEDLFDRDGRRRSRRRSGLGGLLERVLGGARHDRSRYDGERIRSYRDRDDDDDDDDERRGWQPRYDRGDDWEHSRRRRRDRDIDLFD